MAGCWETETTAVLLIKVNEEWNFEGWGSKGAGMKKLSKL